MSKIQFGTISCSTKIQGMYSSLNTAERSLADYILTNQGEVVQMTIDQLSQQSGISYSTICRFCRKLGMNGYKDFKNSLTTDLLNQPATEDLNVSEYEINRGETTQQICEKTFHLFNGILSDCATLLDLDTLAHAVNALLTANTLHIIGAGASAASAMYAHTRLLRLGVPCSFVYDPAIYMMESTLLKKQDVLLAISSSGRTNSVVNAARQAKENGASVISISDYCVSPLQKCSDINLYTTTRNVGKYLDVDMPLTIGQIAIIDIVYSCCCAELGNLGREYYMRTKVAADANKSK